MKPERWGSPLVQEKYQKEKTCDKRHPYIIIKIIIIIIIILYAQVCSCETYNALEATITKHITLPNLKNKNIKDKGKTLTDVFDTSDRLAK